MYIKSVRFYDDLTLNHYEEFMDRNRKRSVWLGCRIVNTPLREVIDASPVNNKQIFFVEIIQKILISYQKIYQMFYIELET